MIFAPKGFEHFSVIPFVLIDVFFLLWGIIPTVQGWQIFVNELIVIQMGVRIKPLSVPETVLVVGVVSELVIKVREFLLQKTANQFVER